MKTIRDYKCLSQKLLNFKNKNKMSAHHRKYLLIPGSSCLELAFRSESSNNMQRLLVFDCGFSPKWQKIKRNQ